jgi:hypothetical protein
MYQKFAEGHVTCWETPPLSDSTEVPIVDRTDSGERSAQ